MIEASRKVMRISFLSLVLFLLLGACGKKSGSDKNTKENVTAEADEGSATVTAESNEGSVAQTDDSVIKNVSGYVQENVPVYYQEFTQGMNEVTQEFVDVGKRGQERDTQEGAHPSARRQIQGTFSTSEGSGTGDPVIMDVPEYYRENPNPVSRFIDGILNKEDETGDSSE